MDHLYLIISHRNARRGARIIHTDSTPAPLPRQTAHLTLWCGTQVSQGRRGQIGRAGCTRSCLNLVKSTPRNHPNVNSSPLSSTQMYTPLVLSVLAYWMRKRDGVQRLLWNKCYWGYRTYLIHPTLAVQPSRRHTIFSSTIRPSTNEGWRQRHVRIHQALRILLDVNKKIYYRMILPPLQFLVEITSFFLCRLAFHVTNQIIMSTICSLKLSLPPLSPHFFQLVQQ